MAWAEIAHCLILQLRTWIATTVSPGIHNQQSRLTEKGLRQVSFHCQEVIHWTVKLRILCLYRLTTAKYLSVVQYTLITKLLSPQMLNVILAPNMPDSTDHVSSKFIETSWERLRLLCTIFKRKTIARRNSALIVHAQFNIMNNLNSNCWHYSILHTDHSTIQQWH